MIERLLGYGFQYTCFALEAGIVVLVVRRNYTLRLLTTGLYLVSLLAVGIGRACILECYGRASSQYTYCFYLTDFILTLSTFLLVCAFFRRACVAQAKLWRFVRLLLVFVFILVAGISSFSLTRNYSQIMTRFIYEFEQNLYFTCLVLNTLLYLLMQQIGTMDDELELLVCGIGIMFAGPAANLALMHLTPGQHFGRWLYAYFPPLCTLGMLLIWLYAIARSPRGVKLPAPLLGRLPAGGRMAAAEGVAIGSKA